MEPTQDSIKYCIDCRIELKNKKRNAKRCNNCLRKRRQEASKKSKAKKKKIKTIKKIISDKDLIEELNKKIRENEILKRRNALDQYIESKRKKD